MVETLDCVVYGLFELKFCMGDSCNCVGEDGVCEHCSVYTSDRCLWIRQVFPDCIPPSLCEQTIPVAPT
jgi:hypothetical protein